MMGLNGWREQTYESFSEGIERRFSVDDPRFPANALWDALNMVYDRDGVDPEKMRGDSQLGATIAGAPTINGLFDYNRGTELVATGTDGKIYSRTSGNFAQLTGGSGFSTNSEARWSGAMFYGATSTANILVLANGIDAPQKYNGTAVSALGGSPPATGNFPTVWQSRLFLASGDTIYYSAVNNCEDFAGAGSGSIAIFRGEGGNITGMAAFAEDLFIFKRENIYRITHGELDSSNPDTSVRKVDTRRGALSHHTIHEAGPEGGGFLLFLSEFGVEAILPTQTNFIVRSMSAPVAALLSARNLAKAHLSWGYFNVERKEYYLAYPSGASTVPSAVLIGNVARPGRSIRWTRSDYNGITAGGGWLSSGKTLQVLGNNAGQVFQLHTGDARNALDYRGMIYTRAYSQKRPHYIKHYGWVYTRVETDGNYNVQVRPVLGRLGLPAPAGSNLTQVAQVGSDGWGVGEWGVALWGGAGFAGTRIRPQAVGRGTHIRLQVETLQANRWFKVPGFTTAFEFAGDAVLA